MTRKLSNQKALHIMVSAGKAKYLLAGFLLLLNHISFSQSKDEKILKGIDYIYKLHFDSAYTIFQPMVNNEPRDPAGYFFIAMIEWWKIYLNKDDENNDANYLSKVDNCLRICEERLDKNEKDDVALFYKGGVIGFRGFLNAIREKWLKAVDDGRDGLAILQRCYEINPLYKDALLGIGLYNYSSQYVMEKYPILKTLLFFMTKGDKQLGLNQLRDCLNNGKFAKTEANVVLCYIHINYENNYIEALSYAQKLHLMYPDNPVFERFLGKSYAGLGNWFEAEKIWNHIQSEIDSNKFGYNTRYIKRETSYHLGLVYLKTGKPDDAIKKYLESISLSKELDKDSESSMQVFATLGAGMAYDLKKDHGEAVKFYDRVLEMKDIDLSHDTAKKFKDTPFR